MDGNNGLFPLAFAVVESENKESWCFFLEWLAELLGGFPVDREWTFMTDRQKGLIEAIALKVPYAVHRKCCRHIFANFRAKFSAVILRKLFWRAPRAYTERDFKEVMGKIKDVRAEAYEWLSLVGAEMWARHSFCQSLKCDHITNNSSESFNSWIGDLREKPVLTLMDTLRGKLMNKLQKRYTEGCIWTHSMTPMVVEKLQKVAQACRTWTFLSASGTTYEVREETTSYVVSTQDRSCDCTVWNLTGIPCKHATTVLINRRQCLEDYCDLRLPKDQYLKAYSMWINPIPDVSFWLDFKLGETPDCLPPELRRRVGRPKKARRREDGEGPAVGFKRSSSLRCGKCQGFGHNKRTCAGGPKKAKKKGPNQGETINDQSSTAYPSKQARQGDHFTNQDPTNAHQSGQPGGGEHSISQELAGRFEVRQPRSGKNGDGGPKKTHQSGATSTSNDAHQSSTS